MNERIEKLSDEAYLLAQSQHSIYSPELLRTYTKQFAELIVRECAGIVADAVDHREPASTYVDKIKQHFGVE